MEIFHMPRWTPQSAQNKEKTSARKKKKKIKKIWPLQPSMYLTGAEMGAKRKSVRYIKMKESCENGAASVDP